MAEGGLPTPLADYLEAVTLRDRGPAFLEVARDGTVLSRGGRLDAYGLGDLAVGKLLAEQGVHLDGFLPAGEEPLVLPSMSFGSGTTFDMHLVPGPTSDWVLLLDASQEVERQRQLQQKANELALLKARAAGRPEGARPPTDDESLDERGERLHVSILFANLRGLARFSDAADPRQVFRTLNAYLRLIVKLVTEASGRVDHVLGDTVTATFGLTRSPTPPEEQSVWAAKRILDEVGALERDAAAPARIGIGIASGPVTYGLVGVGGRRAFSAIGHRVNSAARLESQAASREILVDEATFSGLGSTLAAGFERADLTFRGEARPVPAWAHGPGRSPGDGGEVVADLPRAVVDELRRITLEGLNPSFLQVTDDGTVRTWGGALRDLGVPEPTAGQPVGELLVFLEGFFPLPESTSIPAMQLDSGRFADIHLFARRDASYVLLLDVTEKVRDQQLLQQRGVDLGILAGKLERRNQFIRQTFGRYLSDEVVEQILGHPTGLALSGETRVVTILMNDLRGFTSMCERLAPQQVVRILNRFLGTMTEIIQRHEGTIDEFIGDAILVLFGAPLARDDDARRAVACAIEMMLAMDGINAWCREEGLPALEMGVGLNTGEVVIGNIGSERRLKYGVVGSNVNLTARIESYTVGGQVLASERTVRDAGDGVRLRGSLEVSPKGVAEPITIHDVAGIGAGYDLTLPDREESFMPVAPALAALVTLVDGKDVVGEGREARCDALSNQGGYFSIEPPPPDLANVRIDLFDDDDEVPGHLYGKVRDHDRSGPGLVYVRFTSIPPLVEAFLQKRLG